MNARAWDALARLVTDPDDLRVLKRHDSTISGHPQFIQRAQEPGINQAIQFLMGRLQRGQARLQVAEASTKRLTIDAIRGGLGSEYRLVGDHTIRIWSLEWMRR